MLQDESLNYAATKKDIICTAGTKHSEKQLLVEVRLPERRHRRTTRRRRNAVEMTQVCETQLMKAFELLERNEKKAR